MKKDIVLIGAGGHCKAVIDVIELENKFNIIGVLDPHFKLLPKVLNYPVLGNDDEIEKLSKTIEYFFICVGQTKSASIRINLFELIKKNGSKLPVIQSPLSHVSKYAKIDDGTIIMHHALVNTNAKIGHNCIINTGALIEHDVSIGNHCHISTKAVLNGSVRVGDESFIGSNTVVADSISIANNTVIGAGSVVIRSNFSSGIYAGNPSQKISAD
jgi:sugar O-acyltransferase (sialic acid O-acetyltransferase NeuD family)